MKFITVQGMTLLIQGVTPGVTQVITSPSTKGKAENKGIYKGTVTVQLTACSQGTYNQTSPITGDFITSAIKNKVENQLVLLEGDLTAVINVPMQNTVSPFQSTTFPATVKISLAGQTKVQGN